MLYCCLGASNIHLGTYYSNTIIYACAGMPATDRHAFAHLHWSQ